MFTSVIPKIMLDLMRIWHYKCDIIYTCNYTPLVKLYIHGNILDLVIINM